MIRDINDDSISRPGWRLSFMTKDIWQLLFWLRNCSIWLCRGKKQNHSKWIKNTTFDIRDLSRPIRLESLLIFFHLDQPRSTIFSFFMFWAICIHFRLIVGGHFRAPLAKDYSFSRFPPSFLAKAPWPCLLTPPFFYPFGGAHFYIVFEELFVCPSASRRGLFWPKLLSWKNQVNFYFISI